MHRSYTKLIVKRFRLKNLYSSDQNKKDTTVARLGGHWHLLWRGCVVTWEGSALARIRGGGSWLSWNLGAFGKELRLAQGRKSFSPGPQSLGGGVLGEADLSSAGRLGAVLAFGPVVDPA